MTFSSAFGPDDCPPVPHGGSDDPSGQAAPPFGAVSLAELIADSGPLPADAALECVQRIAERLTSTACLSCGDLDPADVFVDDDGGVWLRDDVLPDGRHEVEATASRFQDMDRLGRLLAFLATGDGAHLSDGSHIDPAILPPPLSSVASRLFSRNGSCYDTYSELAQEAAQLRVVGVGTTEPSHQCVEQPAAEADSSGEPIDEPVPGEIAATQSVDSQEMITAAATEAGPTSESGRSFIMALLIVFLVGAGVACIIWKLL